MYVHSLNGADEDEHIQHASLITPGVVSKLEAAIAQVGSDLATSKKTVSYEGRLYLTADVLKLIPKSNNSNDQGKPKKKGGQACSEREGGIWTRERMAFSGY